MPDAIEKILNEIKEMITTLRTDLQEHRAQQTNTWRTRREAIITAILVTLSVGLVVWAIAIVAWLIGEFLRAH